jgi:hypothetical protein
VECFLIQSSNGGSLIAPNIDDVLAYAGYIESHKHISFDDRRVG